MMMPGEVRLPPAAQRKLAALTVRAEEVRVLSKSVDYRLAAALAELEKAQTEKKPAEEITALEGAAAELRVHQKRRAERAASAAQLLNQIRVWAARLPRGSVLSSTPGGAARPADGETHVAAIERVRADIESVRWEQRSVSRAPLPVADVKAGARVLVAEMAERGRPTVIGRGKLMVRFSNDESGAPGASPSEVADLMAWFDPERMVERIEAEVDLHYGEQPGAMSAAEKEQRGEAAAARMLELERAEESLIEQALAADQDVDRRPFADVRAVLAVEVQRPMTSRAA